MRDVTTVWCAECDGSDRPHRLGTVRQTPEGVRLWDVEDRKLAGKRKLGNRHVAAQVLSHPLKSSVPVPDELPASCEKHGIGRVSSSDVLNAGDNVVLKLKR